MTVETYDKKALDNEARLWKSNKTKQTFEHHRKSEENIALKNTISCHTSPPHCIRIWESHKNNHL